MVLGRMPSQMGASVALPARLAMVATCQLCKRWWPIGWPWLKDAASPPVLQWLLSTWNVPTTASYHRNHWRCSRWRRSRWRRNKWRSNRSVSPSRTLKRLLTLRLSPAAAWRLPGSHRNAAGWTARSRCHLSPLCCASHLCKAAIWMLVGSLLPLAG